MGFCVVTNSVNREEEVTAYLIPIGIIECDNVREVVVRQMFLVHLQQIVVRTENNRERTRFFAVPCCQCMYPGANGSAFGTPEAVVGIVKG